GKLITSKKEIRQAVAKFTSSCGEKLRREKTCARKLHVFIQTNPHRPQDQQYFQSINLEIPVATNLTTELMKYSMRGLDMIFQQGYNYQKAGVMVLELVSANEIQLGLFDQQCTKKNQTLMDSIDQVNKTYGKDVLRFGVQDYGNNWKLKQGKLSRAYTTRLDELPKVKAS
ncbi:MAG: DUF4113 domain-containing protein, partial [Flavisolibacter sp.]